MFKFILCLVFLSTTAIADSRLEAAEILGRLSLETSLPKRLNLFSQLFVGLPYGKNGPLGEGPDGKYDQDPLYRFDTFDCTTYLETVMALALSRDVTEFEDHLNQIRYEHGEIDYLKRNHFTDLQWIPLNVKNGYLKEINLLILPSAEIETARALINFPGWLRSIKVEQIIVPLATREQKLELLAELHLEADAFSSEIATVGYIPIKTLLKKPSLLNRIPDATLVNFVRPNWDLTEVAGTHQNISHQGFLFYHGSVLYLRHASTAGKVEELPFIQYLKKFQNHATLKGIHLMQMVD